MAEPPIKNEGDPEPQPNGLGWTDKPDSAEVIAELTRRIGVQQRKVANSSKSHLDGQVDRGQHQKLLLGAFGTLRVFEDIPAAVKVGPFAGPVSYRVACRFSNGQPCPFPDTAKDVRGVAIKFFTVEGDETDLLMTNEGGRSHASNALEFMNFADVLVEQIDRGVVLAGAKLSLEVLEGELRLTEAARVTEILGKEVLLHKVESLTSERYWGSVVKMKLGGAAIKYSLQPDSSPVHSTNGDPGADDYLRADLRNRLEQGPLNWQLCVQLFSDEDRTPVNDASIVWEGTPIAIGELVIPNLPSEQDERQIDQMAFNPGNGFDPLGITHARQAVYAASAENRRPRGLLSSAEAHRLLTAGG
jgi:hypothetical protein